MNRLPWHHQIDFGSGVLSPGATKIDVLRAQADVYFKNNIKGKSVLDIGCWDGFNSFEAKRRGASRVVATDHFAWSDQCWGNRASIELAREELQLDIEIIDIDLPEISRATLGEFDVVLFLGVFYHLRHPFSVLENISKLADEILVVETHLDALEETRPSMIFYPTNELASDQTNWWGPNAQCVIAMMKDVGFVTEHVVHPMYANRGIFTGHRAKS